MTNIKVSVIIPIYNAQKYLRECLNSLAVQSLSEIEFIMVNDGSTDESETICKEFSGKDKRFVLITQENGGSASARRTGMLKAQGEYLGFVDSDDWVEPNMFERMYSVAKQNNTDIVFCNCYRDYCDGSSIRCNRYIRNGYYSREEIESDILSRTLAGLDLKGRNHVIRWANYLRIYRRELIEKHNIYNDPRFRRCQDLQITFESTLYAESYFYLGDDYLYHNRVVNNSQSRGYTKDQWQKIRILIEKLYADIDLFKDDSLYKQMDLCAFFFAVYSCENERKKCRDVSLRQRINNLNSICNDNLTERFIMSIPVEKLSKVNQRYYNGLKSKKIMLIAYAIVSDVWSQKLKKLKEKILSNKLVREYYLKLKNKA